MKKNKSFNSYIVLLNRIPKTIINTAMTLMFLAKYRFLPPEKGTDLVGYETLIDFIDSQGLLTIEGELVEIGVFLGGGTYKLSKYLNTKKSSKQIYAIDIFNITADSTQNTEGASMSELYRRVLKGRDQWEVFCSVTEGCDNIVCISGDSMEISIPVERICFAFVDGNHDPGYVRNDYYMVWPRLSPGGVVAFDDYGHDLPGVTKSINGLLRKHASEISYIGLEGKIIFIQKDFPG